MVRIRVPAATAVAVMALSACGSIHGPYPQPGEAGTAIDYVRFPPPPPMPTRPLAPADARAGASAEAELARLDAALGRLTGEIEQSRRRLADLKADLPGQIRRIAQFDPVQRFGEHNGAPARACIVEIQRTGRQSGGRHARLYTVSAVMRPRASMSPWE